ncbi:Glucose-6-phosphate 1-epimerase [Leucoagaricus sp. SymC.cos]|nr:Glucose-6-phosphate 1-epimerase [Leucoagaricus sp. SymC.cos]
MPVEQLEDRVILKHPHGASTEILYYGATLISWKTGGTERLFLSSKAALDGSKPEHMKLSQHGFARSERWTYDSIVMDNNAGISVRLILGPTTQIASKYEPKFTLAYVVTLAEHQLSTDLHVCNPPESSKDLEFQALLHTYHRVPAALVRITPLQNVGYYDKTQATDEAKSVRRIETRAEVDVHKFTDFVYENVPGDYTVAWPDGKTTIKTKGFSNVVVWNPREEGKKIGDMEEGGWERFVCVEPGYVRGFLKISPGEKWIGQQTLTIV